MMEWGIYRTEAPKSAVSWCPAIEFCGTSAGKKEFSWLTAFDSLLADISIVVVLSIRFSNLATSRPVLTCTGIALVALGVVVWRILR